MKRNVLMDGNGSDTVMIEGLGIYVPVSQVRSLQAEVELMRSCRDAERQWEMLMMRLVGEDGLGSVEQAVTELKQERDQLTVHIQRIDTLAWKFLTYPNEAQTLEDLNRALSNSPVQNIAQHDAEVVEHETQRCIEAVEAEPEYPDEAPPELMKYINQCIENKDAAHMLHMMRHSVRLTKSEIVNRIRGLPTQQAKEVQS